MSDATTDTSPERVKEVVRHLRAYGFDMQTTDSSVGCLLESLAAERDALKLVRDGLNETLAAERNQNAEYHADLTQLREAAHTAVLKIQDGAASHAEGVLASVLADQDTKGGG